MNHGVDCAIVKHHGTGYLHEEHDYRPFLVDNVWYCGRCHMFLQAGGIIANKEMRGDSR